MNDLFNHTDDPDHRSLPPDVRDALAEVGAAEQAQLVEAWLTAAHYLGDEPTDAIFERLGDEIWRNLEAALNPAPAHETTAPPAKPAPLRLVKAPLRLVTQPAMRWSALAACIALLIAVGVVFTQRPVTVTAPYGEIVTHDLPDGSQLILNSGTKISYSRAFGQQQRHVKLDRGEVFFDVTRREETFAVETFNGAVTVLGTRFNVRARPDDLDPATVVAVESGQVAVAGRRHPGQRVVLQAGQSARLDKDGPAPVALDEASTGNALAWRAGGFKFADAALGTVVREVERRYDVRVEVTPERLLEDRIGILKENSPGAEEILREICELNGYECRTVPGGYVLAAPDAE